MPKPIPDFLNKKYGKLTIIEDLGLINSKRIVKAICDCGIIKEYKWNSIQQGRSNSCGCYNLECIKDRMTIHGLTKHPLYTIWVNIRQRCHETWHKQYDDYGGRGILVCDEWRKNFLSFFNWAITNGWQKGLTIDRENNDVGYNPNNCRIVTNEIQQRNKRNNINFTINGITKTLKEWCMEMNLNYKLTHQRYKRDNIPLEKLLNQNK